MLRVERLSKIFENATDQIVGGIRDASFALEAGTFFTLLGPVRLRQDHDAALHRRARDARRRRDRGRRPAPVRRQGAHQRAGRAARHRHGVPVLRDLAAHDGGRERGVSRSRWPSSERYSRAEIAAAVRRALAVVDLDGFQERSATRLSGGQQQRVALARAIVHEPGCCCSTSRLSNLDAQLRDDMRGELKRLQSKIGITTVYVTHDQSEALALSDRIAVIDRGRITQIGSPQDIYFRPANPFVARFVGATNLLAGPPARRRRRAAARSRSLGGRQIQCVVPQQIDDPAAVSVSIRPESIRLARADAGTAERRQLPGRPRQRRDLPGRGPPGRCRERRRRPAGRHRRRPAAAGRRRGLAAVRAPSARSPCRGGRLRAIDRCASRDSSAVDDGFPSNQARRRQEWQPRNTRPSRSRRRTASPG